MLLTVNGPRNARELAELVKALMDWCTEGGQGDLDAVLAHVQRDNHIVVSAVQRDQVYDAVALALPIEAGERDDPALDVTEWVGEHVRQDPHVLYKLLMNAWMGLCAQAEADATRANEERERSQRDPVAETVRRLTLAGRYYVVAHNGRGKPILSDAVIGLGLAAGIIGELVIAGRIGIDPRTHHLQRATEPPPAPAAEPGEPPVPPPAVCRTAEDVLAELPETAPTTVLRDYLDGLAAGMEERLRAELLETGVVSPETRGMLRERTYFAPAHRGLGKAIRALVGGALYTDPISPTDALLAELAIATGLDAKQTAGWDRLSSMSRGDALAKADPGPAGAAVPRTAQLKLLVDLTAAEVDAVVTSPGM